MTAIMTRPERNEAAAARRLRVDAPVRHSEVYPESLYLRRWAARQVGTYQNLLLTVAAAVRPAGTD